MVTVVTRTNGSVRPTVVPWLGAPKRGPLTVYVVLCGGLLVVFALTAHADEWLSDTWLHAATVTEVARRPIAPLHAITGAPTAFPYFSPYMMVLGWVMSAADLPAFTILTVGGLVSTGLFFVAWWALVRTVTTAPWAPPVALICLLTVWGPADMWYWSGFFVLGTWSVGFSWPSVLAAAGWFELWRIALRLDVSTDLTIAVRFLLLPGLILLIHPFTAAVAAIAVAVTLLTRVRLAPRRVVVAVLLGTTSLALTTLWPWINVLDLLGGSSELDRVQELLYQDLPGRFGFLLLVVPALVWRLRRDRGDALTWTAVVCGAGVLLGMMTGSASLSRLWPGLAASGHLALAALLAERWLMWPTTNRLRRAMLAGFTGAVVCAVVLGLWGQRGVWARAVPAVGVRAELAAATRAVPPYPELSFVREHVREGDIAISNDWRLERQFSGSGLYAVRSQWPAPGLRDASQRTAVVADLLAPATPRKARSRLLERWRIRWIVWMPTPRTRQWPYRGARRVACGPDGIALLLVDDSANNDPQECPL